MGHQFTTLTSRVIPLPVDNVDTDQIIPARFLKVTDKNGLAEHAFADWRQDPAFIINQPEAQGCTILLAGDNFGSGSSREHAPWALTAWGLRAVISTRFADIFKSNALKNGLLPVEVSPEVHAQLMAAREQSASVEISLDLESQTLTAPDGSKITFDVDPFAKHCLLNGMDQLDYLVAHKSEIEAFEARTGS